MQPIPEMSQHHMTEAEPPATRGYENVVEMVAKRPEILNAKEKVDR
jgi:hypothetical protein